MEQFYIISDCKAWSSCYVTMEKYRTVLGGLADFLYNLILVNWLLPLFESHHLLWFVCSNYLFFFFSFLVYGINSICLLQAWAKYRSNWETTEVPLRILKRSWRSILRTVKHWRLVVDSRRCLIAFSYWRLRSVIISICLLIHVCFWLFKYV